jgi:hypothetical protein
MMKKRIICILSIMMFVSALWAQKSISDINRLKRDKDYLYGEATLDTKEAALNLAYELLEVEIKNWALNKNEKISSVLASKVYDYADTIVLKRYNMVRAFAYVKKSNLKTVKGRNIRVDVNKDVPLSKPLEETPQKKETVLETLATKVKPVPQIETPVSTEPETQKESLKVSPTPEEKVFQKLKGVTSFYDLERTMKPLKAAGEITDYGKYATMTDPANCYLIIYDQQAAVKAILGKGVEKRKNLKTGIDDSEKNYHGCGAIWFKVKE